MYMAGSDNELNFNQAYEVNTCMAFLKITHAVKVLWTFSRLLGKMRSLSHMNYFQNYFKINKYIPPEVNLLQFLKLILFM